jgi:hypothetical protein
MKYNIPLQIVELEDDNFHLIVTSVFSDGSTGRWVVDTGASKTVFDRNAEEKYTLLSGETDQLHTAGIGSKPVEATAAVLVPFSLGKMHVEKLKVALIDLSHINELYTKSANLSISGLLGGDFLMRYRAVIDYRKKVMQLRIP